MSDHSEWPKGRDEFRLIIEKPNQPDRMGRHSMTLLWFAEDGRHKAQCFFCKPQDLIDRTIAGGRKYVP